ncbi:hypothetical protein [Aquabacterium sp. J223]|uniref:hypothetical protein n=1 Tax=Aquabacterium sp. J223 TaxID=2898431 RepID=UPI0021AD5293|nr:hypothetical protein [Aquabacterium sp. J223]UUX96105.1 hypothetical protein LRS07_01855 [Aquabacterium sp. J223]
MRLTAVPSVLTLVLGLAGGTLLAQAPAHDVDAVTDTPALQGPPLADTTLTPFSAP